ncbi:MAG: hypothetical protein ACREAA_19890 [Candidatus Polarisedimenticolia bacterium]
MRVLCGVLLAISAALCGQAFAAVPSTIHYQGRLLLNDAIPSPFNGTVPIQAVLWDDATAGTQLWTETWASVTVTDGVFHLVLGSLSPIPALVFQSTEPVWLEMIVDGEVISPRRELTSSMWSFRAEASDMLGGLASSSWQLRVSGACPPGSSIQTVGSGGAVTCETDDTGAPVPAGAVTFVNLPACPPGWSLLAAGQGHYVVGLSPGGTLLGTPMGTYSPLTDRENRPVGGHTHTKNDPGHRHGYEAAVPTSTSGGSSKAGYQHRDTDLAVTGISVNSTGPVGTNAPYVQLLLCQKD